MASDKIIEDALMKQVSESAVSAIVGSLESHLASASSQPDVSGGGGGVVPSRPMLGSLQGLTPNPVRPRGGGGGSNNVVVRTASGGVGGGPQAPPQAPPQGATIIHALRPPNMQNIQLVTVPANLPVGIRGRGGVATAATAMMTGAGPGPAGLPRAMGPGPAGQTVVIGHAPNQVRVTQPTLVQPGQGVPAALAAPGNHFILKTEAGFQLVRFTSAPPPGTAVTAASPVQVPVSIQNAAALGAYRFHTAVSAAATSPQQQQQGGIRTTIAGGQLQQMPPQQPQQQQQPQRVLLGPGSQPRPNLSSSS